MKSLKLFFLLLLLGPISHAADFPGMSLFQLTSKWTDQNNSQGTLSQLEGKPHLVAMVFTRCETACPLLVRDIKSLPTQMPVALFSFDAEKETPESLKTFLKKFKVDEPRWSAYTSTSSDVAELAAALGVKYKKLPNGAFIHANVIFVIDSKGQVVAKNEGLGTVDPAFVEALRGVK